MGSILIDGSKKKKCNYEHICNFKKSSGCLSNRHESPFFTVCIIYKLYKYFKKEKK